MVWIRIKQATAVIAIAIGALGTVLSVQVCRYSWSTAESVNRATEETCSQLEAVVGSVHEQSVAAVSIVSVASDRVQSVRASVGSLAGEDEQNGQVPSSYLKELDEEVLRRLAAAEEFVVTMQETLRNTGSALMVLDSLPLFSRKLMPQVESRETQLQTLAASLTELSDLLEQATRVLTEIRTDSSVDPKQLAQIEKAFARVEQKLTELEGEATEFSERLGEFQSRISDLRISIPQRVERFTMLATIFFVCFACSQLGLMAYAWGTLKSARSVESG